MKRNILWDKHIHVDKYDYAWVSKLQVFWIRGIHNLSGKGFNFMGTYFIEVAWQKKNTQKTTTRNSVYFIRRTCNW